MLKQKYYVVVMKKGRFVKDQSKSYPVRMTGLLKFSSRKDSADAVYDKVSVPCRTTKPSASS